MRVDDGKFAFDIDEGSFEVFSANVEQRVVTGRAWIPAQDHST